MMNKVFKDQIKRNLEVYMNDMLVKSKSLDDHLLDLEENIIVMKHNKVKINPTKCVFKEIGGKFLRFMLTKKGIKLNLTKCRAILEMRSLATMKEV